jgi:hypothetical protein
MRRAISPDARSVQRYSPDVKEVSQSKWLCRSGLEFDLDDAVLIVSVERRKSPTVSIQRMVRP